jgi:hypothetical protein
LRDFIAPGWLVEWFEDAIKSRNYDLYRRIYCTHVDFIETSASSSTEFENIAYIAYADSSCIYRMKREIPIPERRHVLRNGKTGETDHTP